MPAERPESLARGPDAGVQQREESFYNGTNPRLESDHIDRTNRGLPRPTPYVRDHAGVRDATNLISPTRWRWCYQEQQHYSVQFISVFNSGHWHTAASQTYCIIEYYSTRVQVQLLGSKLKVQQSIFLFLPFTNNLENLTSGPDCSLVFGCASCQ